MNQLHESYVSFGLIELTALIAASTAIAIKVLDIIHDLIARKVHDRKNRKEVNHK